MGIIESSTPGSVWTLLLLSSLLNICFFLVFLLHDQYSHCAILLTACVESATISLNVRLSEALT